MTSGTYDAHDRTQRAETIGSQYAICSETAGVMKEFDEVIYGKMRA